MDDAPVLLAFVRAARERRIVRSGGNRENRHKAGDGKALPTQYSTQMHERRSQPGFCLPD
jgi:hypothetical protein